LNALPALGSMGFEGAYDEKKPQISPLRCALWKNISTKGPLNCRFLGFARDDKGKGNGSIESGCWTEAFFITLGGPQAHDSSGRNDKFVWARRFVISTGA
jgi:hypothetical protein